MACSLIGSFLVLRKISMIGDAISHAVLPGIVIAYLVSGSRGSFWMLLGAAFFGFLAVFLIQRIHQFGLQKDASIGIVFTGLFALGVILVSVYSRQIDLDLDCVLFGEIAFVPWNPLEMFGRNLGPKALWLVGSVLVLNGIVISIFYKQFKISSFDPTLAVTLGIPVVFFHYVLMGLVSLTTVASFESVGAILVVGMLVIPSITAYLLTERLCVMIGLSMLIGVLSAIAGYGIASWLNVSISGAMISVAGLMFFVVLFLSPREGILIRQFQLFKRKYYSTVKLDQGA